MSFGFSVGDFISLTQLAWTTVQNARLATGAHHELTRELTSLHLVLQRLEREKSKPGSLLNQTGDDRRRELSSLLRGCRRLLRRFIDVLEKYNELAKGKKNATSIWQKLTFGNGEMQDLGEMRLELVTHTNAMTMFLNLLTLGSQGKVERYFSDQGKDLQDLRQSVDWIVASLQAESSEGSVLSSHSDDDKATWKVFRHKLIKEGFRSSLLRKHEQKIMAYALELGKMGALDGLETLDEGNENGDFVEGDEQRASDGSERHHDGANNSELLKDIGDHLAGDSEPSEDGDDGEGDDQQQEHDEEEDKDSAASGHEASQSPSSPREVLNRAVGHASSDPTSPELSRYFAGNISIDKVNWKQIRRDLTPQGFSKSQLEKNKTIIMACVEQMERSQNDNKQSAHGVSNTGKRSTKDGSQDESFSDKSNLPHSARSPQVPLTGREYKHTERDSKSNAAARFNIDPLCNLDHWDSTEEPIRFSAAYLI